MAHGQGMPLGYTQNISMLSVFSPCIIMKYRTITFYYILLHTIMVGARIIERKLRSTKVRLFTVPCCSIILFSSEGTKKKQLILTYSYFFRRSILILVCSIIVFSPFFPHLPVSFYNYVFRSIINFA